MEANQRQVGGAHYNSTYQHWDFVLDAKLPYLEGQITKYLSRHRKKNGRQDLEKALHYAHKLQEAAQARRVTAPAVGGTPLPALAAFLDTIPAADRGAIAAAVLWRSDADLAQLVQRLTELLLTTYTGAE